MTEREKVQASIGRQIGKQWYGSEQRLGQFLLNVARSDAKLQARREQIVENFKKNSGGNNLEEAVFVWFWDITDEEWESALKRYTDE